MVKVSVGDGAQLVAAAASLLTATDPSSLIGCDGLACINNVHRTTKRYFKKKYATNKCQYPITILWMN